MPGVTWFAHGRFRRTFAIPPDVAVDAITAAYNNGMFVVALPSGRPVTPHRTGINTTAAREIPVGAERWLDKGRRFLRRPARDRIRRLTYQALIDPGLANGPWCGVVGHGLASGVGAACVAGDMTVDMNCGKPGPRKADAPFQSDSDGHTTP